MSISRLESGASTGKFNYLAVFLFCLIHRRALLFQTVWRNANITRWKSPGGGRFSFEYLKERTKERKQEREREKERKSTGLTNLHHQLRIKFNTKHFPY